MPEREDGPLHADIDPALEDAQPMPPMATPVVEVEPGPSRVSCRTDLHGWAGGHLHGAVRPRRRASSRGRPPGRWC
ncbi:hypothetical protein BJ973_005591 [Actinoplanes tereljensis]|uniref:hypothetical protein n=1 Tax=Paractinoplanes tereljensis TaxID=571912 RepID=UPI001940DA38|nr:hypothetical protein [Actinoplanes tereljensis]